MIHDSQLPELSRFRTAERGLPMSVDDSYADLVSPRSNEDSPVHRWFRFKESFSGALVRRLLQEVAQDLGAHLTLLDPFCGVATTILAAQQMSAVGIEVSATGIEYNPFIQFVASTKVNWAGIEPTLLMSAGARALQDAARSVSMPATSSISSQRCISRHIARRILMVRDSIHSNERDATRDALLLGLASAVEPLSRTRKDGRALRIVDRAKVNVNATIWNRWLLMADDVAFMAATRRSQSNSTVLKGDGRRPTALGLAPGSFDAIITSPPYPNNIDYTEVYKLELWLMGLVRTPDEFFELRRQTFRSHPTTTREDPTPDFLRVAKSPRLRRVLWPLLERTRAMNGPWRGRVVAGYFEDLHVALQEYFKVLRPGGVAMFVVGNSLHGGVSDPYLIPTDLILANLARECGFEVDRAIVARAFKRRLSGNHFLRETIVVVRKPNG